VAKWYDWRLPDRADPTVRRVAFTMTAILGVSAFYHDSAAALVVDGEIVAAAQEERFTRKKHDRGFPGHAIDYCLEEARLTPERLDYVGFYDKPVLKMDRLIETYLAYAPAGFASFSRAMPEWLHRKLHLPRELRAALRGAYRKRFIFTEHHEAHAASAFFPSPFEEAAILTLDGVGEWATATLGRGRANRIELTHELRFPHSVGLLYAAFTAYCGFEVNDGEYKLMGLAPYGEPRYVDLILNELIDLKPDGSIRLDLRYFNFCQGLTMTSERFHRLLGGPPRAHDAPIEQRHMDVAASIQKITEEIMLRMARHVHAQTGLANLCLAGGVALNCVGNGRLLREGPFERIWIQPAAGDAGGALGVALFIWHQLLGKPRDAAATDALRGSLLGPSYDDDEIGAFLRTTGAHYERLPDDDALCERVAAALDAGKVVGWFQGRMEFGPRALGARSILADPRRAGMQETINSKVKFREEFRPFAPAVLKEQAAAFFDMAPDIESPYMLLVAPVLETKRRPSPSALHATGFAKLQEHRSEIPAVTHVDYSARVQTIDRERHGLFRTLVETFHRKTGCPVVVNTSFNLGWDPIVRSPREAFDTFMASEIDLLCMGRYLLSKDAQPAFTQSFARSHADDMLTDLVCCPRDGAALRLQDGVALCTAGGHVFEREDGLLKLFWPHEGIDDPEDVTRIVKAFYEENPFPNYDDHDSVRSLVDKARKGVYARALDRAIPYNSTVLEVGCGTGQLTNFLGISCRRVIGADVCLNSLRLGETFRRKHDLWRVRFLQMNLFRPCLRPEQFDVVICNGVLHSTADPYGGFRSILSLLKPGGHIVIGLYNRYGRLATDLRRQIFRLTGGRAEWLDPILRSGPRAEAKRRAWFADQYLHPHESKHTIDELLRWFDESGVEFVRGVPSFTTEPDTLLGTSLFEPRPRGSALDHVLVQAKEVFAGSREGGFFIGIGKKPETRPAVANAAGRSGAARALAGG
jgi:carbamoyltransferase